VRGFDTFVVVDWSAGSDRGPKPKKDAIWAARVTRGVAETPVYLRNRQEAETHLSDLIEGELAAGRRALIGFDFPFGYPRGFAARVVGRPDPLALWDWFAAELTDSPLSNDRFHLAARLNGLFPGVGPFWFNGVAEDIPGLPRKGTNRRGHGMPERRIAEARAKGAFTLWQMGGAGAVGGQAMTGMAALSRLRARFPERVAVWPFETLDRPIAFVEVWPSLVPLYPESGEIRDRSQVRQTAWTLAELPMERLRAMLDVNAPEEGWILGLGFEEQLREVACPA
jgi:molybdopterin molybdotransferase